MVFLIAMFVFIILGTARGMEPDIITGAEIVLHSVKNDTTTPIDIHQENHEIITLQPSKIWICDKQIILLTPEELIKMNPQVIDKIVDGRAALTQKRSKHWQYNEIISLSQQEKKEQLELTSKEQEMFDFHKNKATEYANTLIYGYSELYEQFLHFKNPTNATNHITFSIHKYSKPDKDAHLLCIKLVRNVNDSCNERRTIIVNELKDQGRAEFCTQFHTTFDIVLKGKNLKESHIKQRKLFSLYDLCLRSCIEHKEKETLKKLIKPAFPLAPKIKKHIELALQRTDGSLKTKKP